MSIPAQVMAHKVTNNRTIYTVTIDSDLYLPISGLHSYLSVYDTVKVSNGEQLSPYRHSFSIESTGKPVEISLTKVRKSPLSSPTEYVVSFIADLIDGKTLESMGFLHGHFFIQEYGMSFNVRQVDINEFAAFAQIFSPELLDNVSGAEKLAALMFEASVRNACAAALLAGWRLSHLLPVSVEGSREEKPPRAYMDMVSDWDLV